MSCLVHSPTTRTSIEQKLKAKNCALLLKNGSPKLREILREVNFFVLKILQFFYPPENHL